jgi:hypothetical protein
MLAIGRKFMLFGASYGGANVLRQGNLWAWRHRSTYGQLTYRSTKGSFNTCPYFQFNSIHISASSLSWRDPGKLVREMTGVVCPNGDGSLALIVWRSILITWQLAVGQEVPGYIYIFCYLLTFLKLKKISLQVLVVSWLNLITVP